MFTFATQNKKDMQLFQNKIETPIGHLAMDDRKRFGSGY